MLKVWVLAQIKQNASYFLHSQVKHIRIAYSYYFRSLLASSFAHVRYNAYTVLCQVKYIAYMYIFFFFYLSKTHCLHYLHFLDTQSLSTLPTSFIHLHGVPPDFSKLSPCTRRISATCYLKHVRPLNFATPTLK